MRHLLGLILFIGIALASVDDDIGQLTGTTISVNELANRMHGSNIVMNNPHLKKFEKTYFIDPENSQKADVTALKKSVTQFRKNMKNAFPFAGYSSIDTNIYNRFVKENIQDEKLRKLGNLLHARKQII